jgi:hypothetical protein
MITSSASGTNIVEIASGRAAHMYLCRANVEALVDRA